MEDPLSALEVLLSWGLENVVRGSGRWRLGEKEGDIPWPLLAVVKFLCSPCFQAEGGLAPLCPRVARWGCVSASGR